MKKSLSIITAFAAAALSSMAIFPNPTGTRRTPRRAKPLTSTKEQAKQALEIRAHNDEIDRKKHEKQAVKARRRALDAAMKRYGGRA